MKRFIAVLAALSLALGPTSAFAAYMGALNVGNGGTGLTSVTAHDLMIGAGTSALTLLAPSSTSGDALVSQGSSSDPAYGTVGAHGGGTGIASPTAHGLLVANGASAMNQLAAAADSIPLWQTSSADPTVTAINNCTGAGNALTYATGTHTFGCNAVASAPTLLYYTTSNASYTFGATNQETVAFNQSTTQASTINLPASPAANTIKCAKDSGNNFTTHNATVKTTDSSTIDGVAGTTGYTLNNAKQNVCFMYNTTLADWAIQ